MRDFAGKVAVVTGDASGIGLGMMRRHLERRGEVDPAAAAAGYLAPGAVGALALDAIRERRFCVLTHPEAEKARARGAADDILPGRDPTHSPPIR